MDLFKNIIAFFAKLYVENDGNLFHHPANIWVFKI